MSAFPPTCNIAHSRNIAKSMGLRQNSAPTDGGGSGESAATNGNQQCKVVLTPPDLLANGPAGIIDIPQFVRSMSMDSSIFSRGKSLLSSTVTGESSDSSFGNYGAFAPPSSATLQFASSASSFKGATSISDTPPGRNKLADLKISSEDVALQQTQNAGGTLGGTAASATVDLIMAMKKVFVGLSVSNGNAE